jgi:hypothetical protein
MMKSIFYSSIIANISIFIGCVTSAPDGSSPEAIVKKSSIGSEVFLHLSFL